MVRCFSVSVVYSIVELNGISFNAMSTIFWVVWRYILVKKKNQTKEKQEI